MTANDNSSPVLRRSSSRKRRRNRHIDVCCDEVEFVIIDDKARTAGLSLASFGRACMLGAPGPRAQRAPHVNAEALAHATAALNKVGPTSTNWLAFLTPPALRSRRMSALRLWRKPAPLFAEFSKSSAARSVDDFEG